MIVSDINWILCSDYLKGFSIWGVMGVGFEINLILYIVL